MDAPLEVGGMVYDFFPKDGNPDGTVADFHAVMNRSARVEVWIAEFDLSLIIGPATMAVLDSGASEFDSTGTSTLELQGYVGDGALALADFDSGDQGLDTFVSNTGEAWMVDVTQYVNDRIAAQDEFVGFALRQQTVKNGRKDWNPPVLTLVPEPSSRVLGATALVVLAACRPLRARRRARPAR